VCGEIGRTSDVARAVCVQINRGEDDIVAVCTKVVTRGTRGK
jgi:hypothetical protein